MRILLAFLLVAGCARDNAAQSTGTGDDRYIFSVRHYGTAEGLPHRGVSSIAQDHLGFIWVATQMGVARFDGYTFVNHTRADGLTMDLVRTVLCDADGLLWLWHPDGHVNILDPLTGQCREFSAHFGERAATTGPIRGICAGNDGTIVFYQAGQLVRYRGAAQGFERMSLPCDGDGEPWRVEENGDIWCRCKHGIKPIPTDELLLVPSAVWKKGGTVRVTRIPEVVQLTFTGHDLSGTHLADEAGAYLFLSSGQAWLSPTGSLKEMHDGTDRSVLDALGTDVLQLRIAADLWLVNGTIRRVRAGRNALAAPVLFDINSKFPEARYGLNDALHDGMGNIWVCGQFGLFKVTMEPDRFGRWLWDSTLVAGVGVNVRGMALMGDSLHVNTQHTGLWTLDARNGSVIRDQGEPGNGLAMIPDGIGGSWRSTSYEVLHASGTGEQDTHYALPPECRGAWSLFALDPQRLLIGTDHGLALADPSSGAALIKHPAHPELDEATVWHLQRDRQGRILGCTEAGIYALSDDGDVLEHWGYDAPPVNGVPHRLPAEDIRHFHEDSAGVFWLATAAQGLVRWDRNKGATRTIGVREGLPVTSIHAVYADRSGALWMPTDNGLVRYDPMNGQVKVFTTADGITNNEFNRIAHVQGPDGRMFFGGFNGITMIDPEELRTPVNAPAGRLALTAVQFQKGDGSPLSDLTADVHRGASIILRPGDRFFTVGMALLNYDDPAQIRYAWRIDGVDEEWNTQAEPHLRFSALPYGEHTLRIKAMDADARWSANELTISIVVVRPVYLRWWFFALGALVIAALVYAAFRYRVRQLQQVIHVRDRIAMDLHDEVGSNLSGIVLFSSAVRKSANDLPEKAAGMLHRISDNSTRAMESMNDIVWSVNSRHDQLGDVLDRMRAFAQPLCEAADIEITFDAAPGLHQRKLGMEERKSLYLIFKEAVNNAVKHAQCSRITVTLRPTGRRIELMVLDNGIGLPATPGTDGTLGGNGLGNMRRRAASVGGEITVSRHPQGGSEVLLRIPTGHG